MQHVRTAYLFFFVFSSWIINDFWKLYQHSLKLGKLDIVWKHSALRTSCFHTNINTENVLYLTNIKHFPCWYTVISTRVELRKREIVWKHDARRAECFHTISSFPNFHECWYNYISIRKKFFYNIAMSNGNFFFII
jgi:hypothetical protein